jgi:hypothetical protein
MLAAARRAVEAGRSRCLVAAQWSRDGACAMGQGGVDGGEGCGGRQVCGVAPWVGGWIVGTSRGDGRRPGTETAVQQSVQLRRGEAISRDENGQIF